MSCSGRFSTRLNGQVPEPVVERRGDEQRRRGSGPGRAGDLGEGHAVDAVRVIRGQRVADREAGVVAGDGEPLVAERVHQRDQVGGERAGVVAVRGLVGQADTALVDRDDLEVPGQRRHHQAPGVPGLGPAVDQQERRTLAADDGVQPQVAGVDVAARERVGEPGREVRRAGDGSGPCGGGGRVHVDLLSEALRPGSVMSMQRPPHARPSRPCRTLVHSLVRAIGHWHPISGRLAL